MSVNIGENGQRSVQVEVEVPGSPEEVWRAIATGPGISSWFVPTEVEEREGGKTTADFGMGMLSESTLTRWDPPRSYVKEGEGMDPEAPPVATEWIVEAKSGDKCVVRVVHSWFASTDDWDGQWESVAQGWKGFFQVLRLVLRHFPGQPAVAFDVPGMVGMSESEAWAALTSPFGVTDATKGQEVRSEAGAPLLAGKLEVARQKEEDMSAILLIREPGPGICQFFATSMGGPIYVSARFFLFGQNATATVAEAKPEWSRWFSERFPMGG